MIERLEQVVINASDPSRLARFWSQLLGGATVDRDGGWSHVDAPGFPRIAFQPTERPRTAETSVHLDIEVDDIETAVTRASSLGGSRVGGVARSKSGLCQVMADPEGNRFCLVRD